MKLIKSNWTSWIPFGNYHFANTDYVVMASKNTKNGMIRFKTVKVHSAYNNHSLFVPHGLINTQEQWNKLIEQN